MPLRCSLKDDAGVPILALNQTSAIRTVFLPLTRLLGDEVGVRPRADDSSCTTSLARAGEQVVRTLERNETARVTCGAEDFTRVRDADGVVGRRVQDQQRQPQSADLFVEGGRADVLDERSLQGE